MADFSIAQRSAGACGGGKRPLPASPGAHSARAERCRARGGGAATPPARNKAPGRAPSPSLPGGCDHSPRVPAPARLRPSGRLLHTGAAEEAAPRPAGPTAAGLAAPARPRPGASLKRPRSPRAPRALGAPRIPYIATAPAKNRAPRRAPVGGGRRRDPAAPARTRAPRTRGRLSPGHPHRFPPAGSERGPSRRLAPDPAQLSGQTLPRRRWLYSGRGTGNRSGLFKSLCAPTLESPLWPGQLLSLPTPPRPLAIPGRHLNSVRFEFRDVFLPRS